MKIFVKNVSEESIKEAIFKKPIEISFYSKENYDYLFDSRWQKSKSYALPEDKNVFFNVTKIPSDYTELYGWFNYKEYYDKLANTLPENGLFAEIGIYHGASICYMASIRPDLKIYGIDPLSFKNNFHLTSIHPKLDKTIIINNIKNLQPNIKLMNLTSMEAIPYFEDRHFDAVYIDANHSDPYVSEDIREWKKKVKIGGILSGHDYSAAFPDVIAAVDKLSNSIFYPPCVWEHIVED